MPMRLYKLLEQLEKAFVAEQLAQIKKDYLFLQAFEGTRVISKKQAAIISKMMWDRIKKYQESLKGDLRKTSFDTIQLTSIHVLEELGLSYERLPKKYKDFLGKTFFDMQSVFIESLGANAMNEARNILAVGIINGESISKVAKRLSKVTQQNLYRRMQVLARDQIGRVMQESVWNVYQNNEDKIQSFRWIGPEDKRTTKYCHNRDMMTEEKPWTMAEVKRLKEKNPMVYKGREITAKGFTFLHPHMQCRHRLIANVV
jgi:SPP1 gp7 family putative phage head morphogenesis protein